MIKIIIPLISLFPLIFILFNTAEFYILITILNVILLLLLTLECSDFSIWFIGFELSILTGISTLSLESRSYRRLYAFVIMMLCTFLSSSLFYLITNYSKDTNNSLWVLNTIIILILLVKIPCFPFSIWLPEAHVEASWPGSTVLAGFALKYAIIAIIIFIISSIIKLDFIFTFLLFSISFSTLLMNSTIDLKKLIANFSVIHMCVTSNVLLTNYNSEFIMNFSWHHHSIITSWLFILVGWVYAISSSRLLRLIISNINLFNIFILILYILVTFSLDLPWTSNFLIEFMFFKIYKDIIIIFSIFCIFFWIIIIAFIIISSMRAFKIFSNDIISSWILFLFLTSIITILLGYSIY